MTASEISTSAVILLAVVGFMILTKISAPLNRFKMGIIIFNIVGIIISGFMFNSLFSISKISLDSFVLVALLSLFSESLFRNFDSLLKNFFKGDGERTAEIEPQMIYVLETNTNTNK